MGRQIHFHMLAEDRAAFLGIVQERDSVVLIERDSDSPGIEPLSDASTDLGKTLCFWNRALQPALKREFVDATGYYRIDGLHTATLEFTPSFTASWEGKPALGLGRLFGDFDPYLGKPAAFEKWYDNLVRWIRREYRRSPGGLGGYVAPEAYEFFKSGGYLLPNFLPPRTKDWVKEIHKQDRERGA